MMRFVWILLLFSSVISIAQSPAYYHIGTDEGLPHETVWCTQQDSLGYMWIGTSNGLCRYDGHEMEVFQKKDGLKGNTVIGLNPTDKGEILAVAFSKGLHLVDPAHHPTIEGYGENYYFTLNAYKEGNEIYSLTESGFYIFDQELEIKSVHLLGDSLRTNRMIQTQKGTYYVTAKGGLAVFKSDSLAYVYKADPRDNYFSIFQEDNNDIWVGGDGKIFHFKENQLVEEISKGLPPKKSINYLLKAKDGNIYVSIKDEGLFVKYPHRANFQFIGDAIGIGKTVINYIYEDNEENIWLSTWGKGVVVLPKSLFQSYQTELDLPFQTIHTIKMDQKNERLFIGTLKNAFLFNDTLCQSLFLKERRGGVVDVSVIKISNRGKVLMNGFLPSIEGHMNLEPVGEEGSNIFSARPVHSSLMFSKSGQKFVRIVPNDSTINLHATKVEEGIQKFELFKTINYNKKTIGYQNGFNMSDSCYWLSTLSGPLLINAKLDTVLSCSKTGSSFFPIELYQSKVYKFVLDDQNGIWLGTDVGLYYWKDEWKEYHLEDGLPDETIKDIEIDQEGHLWMASNVGIIHFDGIKFYTYNRKHGLLKTAFNDIEINQNKQILYAANSNGITKASIAALKEQEMQYPSFPFYIQSIQSDTIDYSATENIQLSPTQNKVKIALSACSYTNKTGPQIQYSHNNQSWINLNKDELNLENLRDGNYEVLFRASQEKDKFIYLDPIQINISPPFYKRLGFILLSVLFLFLLLILYTNYRLKKAEKESNNKLALQRKMNYLEQRALSASMNPHFIFNALNSVQELTRNGNQAEVDFFLSQFGKLIRSNLEATVKDTVLLDDEIERLEIYLSLEKLRFKNDFRWNLNIDPHLDTEYIAIPSMIIQPYVENAIWHGIRPKGKGHILISIQEWDDQLHISIQDDGIGYQASQKLKAKSTAHNSMGQTITAERIRLFGLEYNQEGVVKQSSPINGGTRIEIWIPLITPDL